jgi:hypothetical protein
VQRRDDQERALRDLERVGERYGGAARVARDVSLGCHADEVGCGWVDVQHAAGVETGPSDASQWRKKKTSGGDGSVQARFFNGRITMDGLRASVASNGA